MPRAGESAGVSEGAGDMEGARPLADACPGVGASERVAVNTSNKPAAEGGGGVGNIGRPLADACARNDPLAGKRQAINDGDCTTLAWPMASKQQPCPVEVGELFKLRSCTIEITRIERTRNGGKRAWVALFIRYPHHADRPLLIPAAGDGYTHDPKRALGLNEDIFHETPPTIDAVEEEDRSPEHKNAGEPTEPEAIPHQVVRGSRGSRDAHQRFLLELGAERVAEQEQPLELRLARLRAESRGRHVDISGDLRVIEDRIAKAERKVERAA